MTLALTFILCLGLTFPAVHAEGGNGSGGGNGQNQPLQLVDCSVSDGMEIIDKDITIVLTFSKNVADVSVRETNEQGIALTTKDGTPADYTVVFPEENEKRQTIELNASLTPGTEYSLTLNTDIIARNGRDHLDKEYTFNFSSAPEEPAAEEVPEDTANDASSETAEETPEKESSFGGMGIVFVIVVILFVLAAVLMVSKTKKKNK